MSYHPPVVECLSVSRYLSSLAVWAGRNWANACHQYTLSCMDVYGLGYYFRYNLSSCLALCRSTHSHARTYTPITIVLLFIVFCVVILIVESEFQDYVHPTSDSVKRHNS